MCELVSVLTFCFVQLFCFKVASEQQVPLNDVRTEAGAILDELGHTFGIGKVRCFAYALIKIFKALFNRVYVNEEGIQMVNVFLVSHHYVPGPHACKENA